MLPLAHESLLFIPVYLMDSLLAFNIAAVTIRQWLLYRFFTAQVQSSDYSLLCL